MNTPVLVSKLHLPHGKETMFQAISFSENSLLKMHVEADKYNSGALVQKYEAGIKGFFKDEELVSLTMFLHLV